MSLLVTIEGLDGMGKSTLISEISKAVRRDSAFPSWVFQTKEPGNAATVNGVAFNRPGPDLRSLVLNDASLQPFERELLFYVDASIHKQFIADQGSALVLSDRGKWSHLAYLRGYLKTKQIDYDKYLLCKQVIERVCAEPDCIVYLKGDLALMKARNANKAKDVIENNSDEFFSVVLDTYEELVKSALFTKKPLVILDAYKPTSELLINVLEYLKGAFNEEELSRGDGKLCRI